MQSGRDEPIFWGSYKGRILKAIAVDGARTWKDLQELTGFSPPTINTVLRELFNIDAIYKTKDNEYRVAKDIYKDYVSFFSENSKSDASPILKVKEEDQKNIVREFQNWVSLKKLQLADNHLFLDGSRLDGLTNHLVENVRKELLIVNPFLDKANIVNMIRERAQEGIKSRILTRSPDPSKKEFIDNLNEYGIEVFTNDSIHAKIMIFDRGVTVVSSMNLYAYSVGGGSWEAGIATSSDVLISDILNIVNSKFDEKETKRWKNDVPS